ncbi:MAG: M56 family metallopeptidase [Candidatus Eisenbacteria bacterium]
MSLSSRPRAAGYGRVVDALHWVTNRLRPWAGFVLGVWCLGIAVALVRIVAALIRIRAWQRAARPAEAWDLLVDTARRTAAMRRAVDVRVCPAIDVPMVVGLFRPTLLVPTTLDPAQDGQAAMSLVLHELAHIQRRDAWMNAWQVFAEVVYVVIPGFQRLSDRVRELREQCCDEVAARQVGDSIAYARALAELEARRSRHVPWVLAAHTGSLRTRIERLLSRPAEPRPIDRARTSLVVGAILASTATVLLVGGQAIARSGTEPSPTQPHSIAALIEEIQGAYDTEGWTVTDFQEAVDRSIEAHDDLGTLRVNWLSTSTQMKRNLDRRHMERLWHVGDAFYRRYTEAVTTPSNIDSLYRIPGPWNETGPGFAFGAMRGDGTYWGEPATEDNPQFRRETSPFRIELDLDANGQSDLVYDGVSMTDLNGALNVRVEHDPDGLRSQWLVADAGVDPTVAPYFLFYRDGPYWMFLLDSDRDGIGNCGRSYYISPSEL